MRGLHFLTLYAATTIGYFIDLFGYLVKFNWTDCINGQIKANKLLNAIKTHLTIHPPPLPLLKKRRGKHHENQDWQKKNEEN